MRILYANVSEERSYLGHRLFDLEWVNTLSKVGKVELLAPQTNWYENVPSNIVLNVYSANEHMKGLGWLNSKIFDFRIFKRLDIYSHIKTYKILKEIIRLDKEKKYDVIIISTLDKLMFMCVHYFFPNLNKIHIIEHTAKIYEQKSYNFFFEAFKNKVNHIVMEKSAINVFTEKYGVNSDRINYIPHPLNNVKDMCIDNGIIYDVVGISNSNSDEYIRQIIENEENNNFFENNRIKAIFRSKKYDYNSEWLVVLNGTLGLTYEQYYSYINNCRLVILPFELEFGTRTSGTIMDALSLKKPFIGSNFETMLQYEKDYPNVCKSFSSIDEMNDLILYLINDNCIADNPDFDKFILKHSESSLIKYMNLAFGLENNV